MRRIEVLADEEEVAVRAAELVAQTAEAAVASHGAFEWAVSGGGTPLRMLGRLALPWDRTVTFQTDERVAPEGHRDRNLTHLREVLPPEGTATLRPMPVEERDLEPAAARYLADLPEAFDLVQLGLGEDGHTASLVPGDPVLDVRDRDVALTGEYRGSRRMTLTYPPLDRARAVLWIVSGGGKAWALGRLLTGDRSIPAGRVATEEQVVVADRAAAPDAGRA